MFLNLLSNKTIACLLFTFISFIIMFILFSPIFFNHTIIFPYSIKPFNIVQVAPALWKYIKFFYIILYLFSSYVFANNFYHTIYNFINKNFILDNKLLEFEELDSIKMENSLNLYLGKNEHGNKIFLPEKGLYQNILITGTIGSRQNKFCYVPFN